MALPNTVNTAKTAWPARQKFWFATYGSNIPGPEPVLPEELSSPMLTLEGQAFPISGRVQGDGPGNSFVYIPSLKAVVAGDTVASSKSAAELRENVLQENPGLGIEFTLNDRVAAFFPRK